MPKVCNIFFKLTKTNWNVSQGYNEETLLHSDFLTQGFNLIIQMEHILYSLRMDIILNI